MGQVLVNDTCAFVRNYERLEMNGGCLSKSNCDVDAHISRN